MAKLYFKYGVMGSAKSMLLLTQCHAFEENGTRFVCMKPEIDKRDGVGVIKSRTGLHRECEVIKPDMDIYEWFKRQPSPIEWLIVDECQFCSSEQIDQLGKIVDVFDVNVFCYGLRTDFRSHTFPASKRLLEIADSLEEVKSYCRCGRKAIINARVAPDGSIVEDGELICHASNDFRYVSMCRKCYNEGKMAELGDEG